MCLWMPAAVLNTFPQFFHRHLNMTFMEFWGDKHGQSPSANDAFKPLTLHNSYIVNHIAFGRYVS